MEALAEKLRLLRHRAGLSARQVVGQVHCCSAPALYSYETGRSLPSVYVLIKLAQFYGVSIDYLVTDNLDARLIAHPHELGLLYHYRQLPLDSQRKMTDYVQSLTRVFIQL